MKAINSQIDLFLKDPDRITIKSRELIDVITKTINPTSSGECLDIGCGSGSFVRNLSYKLKNYNFTGFDISEKLIEAAITLNKNKSVKFLVGDFNSIEFNKKFNFITASGVLSVFQEFEAPLKKWLSWLTEDGYLFMAGRFNSRNIDTQILFRNNLNQNPKWEGGLSAYSINTISNFIKNLGFKCEFKKFNLPVEIKEDINNPIRTFTKELKNGEKIVMDGANIVAEHYLVKIGRNLEN